LSDVKYGAEEFMVGPCVSYYVLLLL